ncbi:MAG TPA: hypothetical protein VEZ11_07650, partial [Thermoanaerobaculia bacterium]|nr:hypothetical protein [Thermoanaerobaculia bacterium]
MFGSLIVYTGLAIAFLGAVAVIIPLKRLWIPTRARAAAVVAGGVLIAVAGLLLPASEKRAQPPLSHLDEFAPVWQFNEQHEIAIAAPPDRVFEAIRAVRADEIFLFSTLTWIRRFGRPLREGILNPAKREPLIDVALRGGFIRLADDPPRELVIGVVIAAPPGMRGRLTPEVFKKALPPGFVLAVMNFYVTPDGRGGSNVTTETRVYANSDS